VVDMVVVLVVLVVLVVAALNVCLALVQSS
jgi:hypothetical protein